MSSFNLRVFLSKSGVENMTVFKFPGLPTFQFKGQLADEVGINIV